VDLTPVSTYCGVAEVVLRESFSERELACARGGPEPAAALAAAWAAKEAFFKAAGCGVASGLVAPHEIELLHDQRGRPRLAIPARIARLLGISPAEIRVSLSHAGGNALAVVALPPGVRQVPAARPMGKTGGIKNYQKTRAEILELLGGSSAPGAPPPPPFTTSGPLHAALLAKADSPELGPIFALARRCGLELRVLAVHPEAFERLDNAVDSNEFRKLAPHAQLHFLVLTLDAASYGSLGSAAPLGPGARGAILVNAGLLEGPAELADARYLLLRSELLHEVAHFERPRFAEAGEGLIAEWIQETVGLARQVALLAQADPRLRARAEALITDTLEGNPIRGSFDLVQPDGSRRRIASKTFLVLETELAELQQVFGTLTPDGMNPALFRLVDRVLEEPGLFNPAEAAFTDAGLEALLRFATHNDRDLRRAVQREMGVQLQELALPPGAVAQVREQLERLEDLLAGRIEPMPAEPTGPLLLAPPTAVGGEPETPAAAGAAPAPATVQERGARRRQRQGITPARHRTRRLSVLVRSPGDLAQVLDRGDADACIDLRAPRMASADARRYRRRMLAAAREEIARGRRVGLRLDAELAAALDQVRTFLPELGEGLREVVWEAESLEALERLEDELYELERSLGLAPGVVGLELVIQGPEALRELEAFLKATPRIAGVELGELLPARLGWIFTVEPGESFEESLERRITEAEVALEPAYERASLLARAFGVPLIHGPMPLSAAVRTETIVRDALDAYDALRLGRASHLALLPHPLPAGPLAARLESLEAAVEGRRRGDPAIGLRLEEDLAVLDAAVARSALSGTMLERYWRAKWRLLYDDGVPATIPIPEQTLCAALLEAAAAAPERCFRYRAEWRTAEGELRSVRAEVPFGEILGPAAYRVAHALRALGVGRGDRVGLSASNTLAHIATFQALALLGAVVVPLDPAKAHLADRFFNDSGIKVIVFDAGDESDDVELHHARLMLWAREQALDEDAVLMAELRRARRWLGGPEAEAEAELERLLNLLPRELRGEFAELWRCRLDPLGKFAETLVRVGSLEAVVLAGLEDFVPGVTPAPLSAGMAALRRPLRRRVAVHRLAELTAEQPATRPESQVAPDDPLAWFYTGGTSTGISKAAVHSHRTLLALGLQRGVSLLPGGGDGREVVATTLPFSHVYGFATGVLTPVLSGADAVVLPSTGSRYLPAVAERLVEDAVTVLFSSRTALGALVGLIPEGADLRRLKRVASSGDTLTPAVSEAWLERFGVAPCSGYGSTETPSSLMNPLRTNRAGTEGIPLANVEARVVDPETGEVLPPGRQGLLQIRGPHVCLGYAGRPEADARAMKPGGWWQKDDIFKLDRDGFFIFCGRADEMFTVNELNVYPETVEQALVGIPGIQQAGVIGVFEEDLGTNRVVAYVVLEPDSELTAEQIIELSKPLLEAHEVPSVVEIVEDLPRSDLGRVARGALRRAWLQPAPPPEEPPARPEPEVLRAEDTLLVFPPAGTHWPGMGEELALDPEYGELIVRAEAALGELGVAPGALRAVMGGRGQVVREPAEDGWRWSGDFPLSVAAQAVVAIALGRAFRAVHGRPNAVIGESMGEVAACCLAGALDIEDAVRLAYRFAQALDGASAPLALRMAVVENLDRAEIEELAEPLELGIVIAESPRLHVVALPAGRLRELEARAAEAGGRALVSNNPCAAHEPRLAQAREVLEEYFRFLDGLPLRRPELPVLSALEPGGVLQAPEELRANLRATLTTPVRWGEAIAACAPRGVRNLLLMGVNGPAYALEKLQAEGGIPADWRIESIGDLARIDLLDAAPGRSWIEPGVTAGRSLIRALARLGGARHPRHLDEEYAARSRHGAALLQPEGIEGIVLAALGRRFPALEVTRLVLPTFHEPVKQGDAVRPIVEVLEAAPAEVHLRVGAANQWGDLLLEGEVWLSPRRRAQPRVKPVALEEFVRDVRPEMPQPAAELREGEWRELRCALDEARLSITRRIFPGGDACFSACLGLEFLALAAARWAPGFALAGNSLLDVRRALAELKARVTRNGVERESVRQAAEKARHWRDFIERLPLSRRLSRVLRRTMPRAMQEALDRLLAHPAGPEQFLRTWDAAEEPLGEGEVTVRAGVSELAGASGSRRLRLAVEVTGGRGRTLYLGSLRLVEAPAEEIEEVDPARELAERMVQQKIIRIFPPTRPREAESAAADPTVNAALIDLQDAVSPTVRKEARPRTVELIGRVRRDSSPAKRGLVAALQIARARLKSGRLADLLLDPAVRDFESLIRRMSFRKRGAEAFRRAMRRPQQRLLRRYLANMGSRIALVESLGQLDLGGKVLKLRPGDARKPGSAADYHEVIRRVGDRIDVLTIPGAREPLDIMTIDRVLTAIEETNAWPVGRLKLEILVEHPLAVEWIEALAEASPRTIALTYDHLSYAAATGGWDPNRHYEYQRYARGRTVRAAHQHGRLAIDGITPSISAERARADAEAAARMGFDGKWAIHLEQILGIRQVRFAPFEVALPRARSGGTLPAGLFDLEELARRAAEDAPLVDASSPGPRARVTDLRAVLRLGPGELPGAAPEAAAMIQLDLRGQEGIPGALPAVSVPRERLAVILAPEAPLELVRAARALADTLVLEAAEGAPLTVERVQRAAEAFEDGSLHLAITRPEELAVAFGLARDCSRVTALIHALGPADAWESSGAVLCSAAALGIDALQGADPPEGAWLQRAFHAAHMGYRGQVVRRAEALNAVREAYTPPRDLIAESAAIVERYYRARRIEHLEAIPYEFTYLRERPTPGLVDRATAAIHAGILDRAVELNLASEEQRRVWRSYALRWVWNDTGEEVDFTRWQWVPGEEGVIQARDNPAQRAELGPGPGRFSLQAP
jgi:phosphopantetheine--protein transferase-like protein